jgi:hypothetical protein
MQLVSAEIFPTLLTAFDNFAEQLTYIPYTF